MDEQKIIEFDEEMREIEQESFGRRVWNGIKDHADTVVTLAAAVLTVVGSCIYSAATKRGVDDYLYTETDDEVYRIPVKKCKTIKSDKDLVKKSI